jgi:RNA polymerase sigma-70 factor (ECF subfamily)
MSNGLEAVFLNNRTVLLRFLRARGASDTAEDLLHDLWFRALRTSSDPIADPLAYLFRTADNLVVDRHRRLASRARREGAWLKTASGTSAPVADAVSGEDVVLARDELRAVEATLASLGERTQLIFRRFRVDGLSQRQVADEMGISLSAVEKHLQRAYRALVKLRSDDDAV